ncbi:class I SAM-dependent methyltransferase [Vibrio hangzhouensis]|uniref:class I SAM-dependent methyltransferase n=1 Tax=Vibrio hangzhouensis TaxID=462991 RepID=UPI001C9507BD|nr:class I SAM-dependent methyltransferase [Vibrio hangzhouensis]MBY6197354.1 class I SAM-dependent methyltransferase [Vibrio hangzhouensis]
MSITRSFYDKNADSLAAQYNSVKFEEVHASWKPYWPIQGDMVLDVGAASGRDARWMAKQGAEVFALEPSQAMMDIGRVHTGDEVTWLQDELPGLKNVQSLGIRFDLILVSAVWMHVAPGQRCREFRKLSNLLAPNGRLVITLRHGSFADDRVSYPVSVAEIEKYAKDTALLVKEISDSDDSLKREQVTWQTVVLSLPDDGSGDLNKVRHIIVNDSKSATYKLALLRVLLRIADAHPGCVSDQTDGEVAIPLGLVALYWIKAYKRLIDYGKLQQSSDPNKGLGFVTDDGWNKLKHLSADDLAVGNIFFGDDAKALQKAIQSTIKTMKEGPIKFITTGSSYEKKREFSTVAPAKKRRSQDTVYLNTDFFESYGFFTLKRSLWECFRIYNAWIEPLIVNQWVMQMQRFELNRKNEISLQTYHNCLVWLDKDRDTREVRKRVSELQQNKHRVSSVWSNTKLNKAFHVDHCLPFAYWPNNDMWNLMPATEKENTSKNDRLPSKHRLAESRHRIVEWWNLAWGEQEHDTRRFFTEASLSLPNLPVHCHDFEEVFEAMGLQIRGLKSRLLIAEW